MTWIRVHDRLVRGACRGISRASRFVLIELTLHAREAMLSGTEAGSIRLPPGPVDRIVHDLVGGSRAEVRRGLQELTDPVFGVDGVALLEVNSTSTGSELRISFFDAEQTVDRTAAERARKYRKKRPNGPTVTRDGPDQNSDVTGTDQSRGDQSRGESESTVTAPPNDATPPVAIGSDAPSGEAPRPLEPVAPEMASDASKVSSTELFDLAAAYSETMRRLNGGTPYGVPREQMAALAELAALHGGETITARRAWLPLALERFHRALAASDGIGFGSGYPRAFRRWLDAGSPPGGYARLGSRSSAPEPAPAPCHQPYRGEDP